ncbi:hypothetical protein [Methylobacterium oryzihabitans]|uniref:Uncharacterized protein n=1 Tax=Methylobacterium oryzihabitans TaxID=2499852 RepID=A0A437NTL4_9HYPH|nr:hypothetical protein [Methylobacterium oryzihabitans]RVU13201.1 hypothetical protein EOE48_26900 [Methylobacterium oryzihabitans]
MKTIIDGVTFSASTRALNFSAVAGFDPRRLLAVFNLTRAALLYAPATPGVGYTAFNAVSGVLTLAADTTGHANADTLVVMYDKPGGDASDSKLDELRALLAGVLSVRPPGDQDPVFDHANGVKATINASALLLTVPPGCKYLRISAEGDIVVNTAGGPAVDDGKSVRVVAGLAEVIPVVAGQGVFVLSLTASPIVVRATPLKARA